MNILWYAAQFRNGGPSPQKNENEKMETSLCDGPNLTLLIGIELVNVYLRCQNNLKTCLRVTLPSAVPAHAYSYSVR